MGRPNGIRHDPDLMLDTSLCIYLMKNQPLEIARRFAQCYYGEMVICAVTFAELSYGVAVSEHPLREKKNLTALVEDIPVVPFYVAAGLAYRPIRLATRKPRKDQLDKMIAALSKALKVTLVTKHVKDFEKYRGIRIANWLAPANKKS